jgi:tetratricopeptide (TPR) repeat protein
MHAPFRVSKLPLRVMVVIVLGAFFSCGSRDGGRGVSDWGEKRAAADRLIVILLEAERFADALALIDSTTAVHGKDPRLLGQKARALGELGRVDEAVPLFERSILADYTSCENHINFAVLLMRTGKIGRAITEFEEAKQFCGSDNMVLIHRNLAVAQFKLGRREKALLSVDNGLKYNTKDPYLLGMGAVLTMETDPVKAESLFVLARRAGDIEPEFLYQYGILLLNSGRTGEAAAVLDTAAALLPNDRDVQRTRAEALLRNNRPEEAEMLLRGLRDRDPDAGVTETLAKALFKQERFRNALDLFRELPESPEVLDRVAMCLHGLGRLEEAAAVERTVIAARPGWLTARINMAVILAARGELEEALEHLEEALEIDPTSETALSNMERLRQAMEEAGRE